VANVRFSVLYYLRIEGEQGNVSLSSFRLLGNYCNAWSLLCRVKSMWGRLSFSSACC